MNIILTLHSIVRWLITLVAIAAIVRFAIGWLKKQAFDTLAQRLNTAFVRLMELQMLLGILFFVWSGFAGTGFPGYRWGHVIAMTIAVALSHVPDRWKAAAGEVRYRNSLIVLVVIVLVIIAGILPIGGWTRWWHVTGLF
jgi:DNA-binding transcriptional regulator of glucitol operon